MTGLIETAVREHVLWPRLEAFRPDFYPTGYAASLVRAHTQVVAIEGDPTSWSPGIRDANLTTEEALGRIDRYAEATGQDVHHVVRVLADAYLAVHPTNAADFEVSLAFGVYLERVARSVVFADERPLYDLIAGSPDGLAGLDARDVAEKIGVDVDTYFRLTQSLQDKGRISYYAGRGYYVTVPRGLVR